MGFSMTNLRKKVMKYVSNGWMIERTHTTNVLYNNSLRLITLTRLLNVYLQNLSL